MKKALITGIMIIGAACLIIGCGKKEEEKEEAEKPKTEANEVQEVIIEDEQYKTIGQENANAYKLLLTNRTGGEITGFMIKASTEQTDSQNLLQAGMKIEQEETVCVYYTPNAGNSAQTTYDFDLSYEDKHVVEIAGLRLDDMAEAELCFEDEVGFVKYKKSGSGEEVSTKEMALALKAQKEAQEAAQAQAKKEEAEQAAAQAQADAAAQAQQEYYEPNYQQYEEPAVDITQTGEECIGEPVVNPGYDPISQESEECLTGVVTNPNYDPNSN